MGLNTILKRLDDRVIGSAERDRGSRRRASAQARAALVAVVAVVGIADYVSSTHRGVPLAVPWVLSGLVIGAAFRALWRRTRNDQ